MQQIQVVFVERRNYEGFMSLLLEAGVTLDEMHHFFEHQDEELLPTRISLLSLKEKLLGDEDFMLKLANRLYACIDNESKASLDYSLLGDGYRLESDGTFRKAKIVFQIFYSDADRVVRVNNLKLTTVQMEGENEQIFSFLLKHPNIRYTVNELREKYKITIKKSLDDVVKNLKFTGAAKKLFFPTSTASAIELRNPITDTELRERGFKESLVLEELFPSFAKKGQKKT